MRTASKTSALILMLFMAFTLTVLTASPINSQTTPPPSVPQFTVQFVNASYSITTTNPYTGQNQTSQVSNCSIQVTIQNQPLNQSGNYQIYYGIRMKPHFGGNWTELGCMSYQASTDSPTGYGWFMSGYPIQSNSSYTLVAFVVTPTASNSSEYDIQLTPEGENGSGYLPAIPIWAQIDFQVGALLGHNSTYWYTDASLPPPQTVSMPATAYDSNSSWSSTQTVQLGADATPAVSSPTFIPVIPTFVWFAIVAVLGSALVFLVIIKFKRFTHD